MDLCIGAKHIISPDLTRNAVMATCFQNPGRAKQYPNDYQREDGDIDLKDK
jgi:hypothetical protein